MFLRGNVLSKTLQMDTGISIITPDDIKVDGSYKVIYLLHGLRGNNGSWADNTMLPVFANEYDAIFVMPEVARSFYSDMVYGLKYYTYITEEIPALCKSVFNISTERKYTAVIGASMGGYGALKCALSRPSQYGACCAISSACLFLKDLLGQLRKGSREGLEEVFANFGEQLITDFKAILGEEFIWRPEDELMNLALNNNGENSTNDGANSTNDGGNNANASANSTEKPKFFMACGTKDYFKDSNTCFVQEMKKANYEITYKEWEGHHDWYFFNEALQKSLMWLKEEVWV